MGRSDSTGLRQAGPAPRAAPRLLPPPGQGRLRPQRSRHRFQSLFIHNIFKTQEHQNRTPPITTNKPTLQQSPTLFRRKIEHIPTPASSYFGFLQSKALLPPACRPEEPKEGRLPSCQDPRPRLPRGSTGLRPNTPHVSHRTAWLCSAPQLSRDPWVQADTDLSLAHTDMIQGKGFQTIKCNRQRDRLPGTAAPAQPIPVPWLQQSLLEAAPWARDNAQDPGCTQQSGCTPLLACTQARPS